MSTTITATATEPTNDLTAPTPGADTDTWGEILNEQTLVTLLAYILWLHENMPEAGAAVWGAITGTLADQTDLQAALNAKADASSLGTAATADASDFATAAQGALADTALQPGDDAADLGSGAATDGYVLTADGAGGAAWEAASGGGSGADEFTDLTDAPSAYTSAAGQYVRVNSTPDGLEFHQLVVGFENMVALDESTYAGLTPDENTIYFIEADA